MTIPALSPLLVTLSYQWERTVRANFSNGPDRLDHDMLVAASMVNGNAIPLFCHTLANQHDVGSVVSWEVALMIYMGG